MISDLTVLINTFGLGQAIVLSLLLWWRPTKIRRSNRFLAIVLVAFGAIILNTIIRLTSYIAPLGWYESISNSVILIIAPSLFFYVRFRLFPKQNLKWWYHYVPFVVYLLIVIFSILLNQKSAFYVIIADNLAFLVFQLQFGIYLYFSFRSIQDYEQKLKHNFSYNIQTSTRWMKRLLLALLVTGIGALSFVIIELVITPLPDFITLNLSLIFVIVIGLLAYLTYINPEVFTLSTPYEDTSFSDDQLSVFKEKLKSIILEEELFLNPKLSIHDLSERTGIPRRQISQLLNQNMGVNFFDYINSFRVEYFKEKLIDPKSAPFTIQALAEKSGFQSMSTAYGAFKKVTGMTPAKYKKSQ